MTTPDKIAKLLKYYFILCGLYILYSALLIIVKEQCPEFLEHEYKQEFLRKMLKENPLRLFIIAVIYAPIMEEMMFRTLIKPSHNDLILLFCSWSIFYVSKLPLDAHWLLKLLFIGILPFSMFYVFKQLIPKDKTKQIRQFLSKYYIPILIVSSLVFGFVHIYNYVDTFLLNVVLITLIIPRILLGFMMGKLKVKNKHIAWSIGFHAINNGVVITIMIISKSYSL